MGSEREEDGKGDGNNWSLSPLESYPQMWTMVISDCVLIRASDFADETPTGPVSHYLIPLFSIHSVFPFMHGHSARYGRRRSRTSH